MGWYQGIDEPRLADEAAIREGLTTAYAATAINQAEAHQMFLQHGPAVITHSVGEPGRAGDPDAGLPDAADQ